MKIFTKLLSVLLFTGIITSGNAQEHLSENFFQEEEPNVRPIRIGTKIGVPNLIGGNLEYVTPLLNKKLAVSLDYSIIKSDWILKLAGEETSDADGSETTNFTYNYIEGGINYYFFKPGRGLYGGISYGVTSFQGTLQDFYSKDENNTEIPGTGTIDFSHGTMNLKLGAKMGGLFYFRPEIGYSFSPIPNSFDIEVVYEDGSREIQTEEIYDPEDSPGNLLGNGLLLNIGLGFAF